MKIWVLILSFFYSCVGHSQVLNITLSDAHSNYGNLPKFLHLLQKDVADFKAKYPHGKVVLLVNGDYGGASGLASTQVNGQLEAGNIGNNALLELKKAGLEIIFNSGNHEAHDFAGLNKNNQLFVKQMKYLKEGQIEMLGSNSDFVPSTGLNEVFAKYYDVNDVTTGKSRVFGLTLFDLKEKSGMVNNDPIYANIENYESTLRQEITQAIQDGIERVTVMIHDNTQMVENTANKIEKEFDGKIKFNMWLAGHDHVEARGATTHGTPLFNAGAQFGYIKWEDHGKNHEVTNVRDFKASKYESLKISAPISKTSLDPLANRITEIAQETSSQINHLKYNLEKNKHGVINIAHGKLSIESTDRTALGMAGGNAMRDWAVHSINSQGHLAIGFMNTSSYRIDAPLGRVEVTDLTLIDMFPFATEAKILEMTGAQVYEIVLKTAIHRENLSSLQISDNIRAIYKVAVGQKTREKYKYPMELEARMADGTWRKILKTEKILVGIDAWTGKNGFGVKYDDNFLRTRLVEDGKDLTPKGVSNNMLDIIREFLPANLKAMPEENLPAEYNSVLQSVETKEIHLIKQKDVLNPPRKSRSGPVQCRSLFSN